jgi:hypothetical protein
MTSQLEFENHTDLPIIVGSWITISQSLGEFKDVVIPANTKQTVYSDVDEWIIGSLFYDENMNEQWKQAKLPLYGRIAKFRNTPCARGDYTWNFIEKFFDLKYENGVVYWYKK